MLQILSSFILFYAQLKNKRELIYSCRIALSLVEKRSSMIRSL